ncbi:MAG: ChbG/HpnK family deacetylase [Saprospiraceae bacterium]|nr:ChbG/HpnK family deacetylase [Saprospiraceae bacterium]
MEEKIPILIRCDDLGMCHDVNLAALEVLEKGFPVSMSVMVPCSWFPEAAEMLKKYKNVSVGVHLTLNSEWKQYRWGPVSGISKVPSLVDSLGYFFPSRSELFDNKPDLQEIETELRAQIEKAKKAGLKIDYLDYHMGAAMQNELTRSIVEKLANEYKVSISRYYGEVDVEGGYSAPVENKLATLYTNIANLKHGGIKLLVFHIGIDNPEMKSMEDLNKFGLKEMSRHRNSELEALISPELQELLNDQRFRLVNYKMLNDEMGQQNMKRPDSQK